MQLYFISLYGCTCARCNLQLCAQINHKDQIQSLRLIVKVFHNFQQKYIYGHERHSNGEHEYSHLYYVYYVIQPDIVSTNSTDYIKPDGALLHFNDN